MGILKWSSSVGVLALAGTACHTRPPAISPSRTLAAAPTVPSRPPAPAAPPATARPAAVPPSEDELFRRKSLDELNAEHPLANAFFDYDQNTLRDDARAALQKDAAWRSKWPQTAISVEGYCDERGTAEYNLALRERRASVVKEYLEALGVSSGRNSHGGRRPDSVRSPMKTAGRRTDEGTSSSSGSKPIVDAVLNLGLPAPIDLQVSGSELRVSGRGLRSRSTYPGNREREIRRARLEPCSIRTRPTRNSNQSDHRRLTPMAHGAASER